MKQIDPDHEKSHINLHYDNPASFLQNQNIPTKVTNEVSEKKKLTDSGTGLGWIPKWDSIKKVYA